MPQARRAAPGRPARRRSMAPVRRGGVGDREALDRRRPQPAAADELGDLSDVLAQRVAGEVLRAPAGELELLDEIPGRQRQVRAGERADEAQPPAAAQDRGAVGERALAGRLEHGVDAARAERVEQHPARRGGRRARRPSDRARSRPCRRAAGRR